MSDTGVGLGEILSVAALAAVCLAIIAGAVTASVLLVRKLFGLLRSREET